MMLREAPYKIITPSETTYDWYDLRTNHWRQRKCLAKKPHPRERLHLLFVHGGKTVTISSIVLSTLHLA